MGIQNALPPSVENMPLDTFSLNELPTNSTLTKNVQQDCFVTTYDKVKLVLIEYENDKRIASNWYNYFAMMISFLIPALTADFRSFWIIDAAFFRAAFWLAAIAFFIVTVVAVILRFKNAKKITIEYCLQTIKNGASTHT